MRKTASGRWVQDRKTAEMQAPDGPDPAYVMSLDWAKDLLPMPWWYPVMSFEAAIGRMHMQAESCPKD